MTIKSARINGVIVDDNMLSRAIEELAAAHGKSVREEHELILSRVDDRNDAVSWASAIAQTAIAQEASPDAMVDEYVKAFPPDRLALTDTDDKVELAAEDALAEVTRLVREDAGRRKPVLDAQRPSPAAPCRTVQLSREARTRLYDDEQLALTSVVGDDRRALDAYLVKLARGEQGKRALGDLTLAAQGQSDRVDTVDTNTSVSDLDREVSLPSQTVSFGQLSSRAADQLSGLAPVYQAVIKAALAAADADDDPAAVDGYFASAVYTARAQGATVLAQELAERASQARLGQSALNDPDEADSQTAVDVDAEVQRYAEMVPVQNGNKSTPPKSVGQRNLDERAARPGYSGAQNPIRQ